MSDRPVPLPGPVRAALRCPLCAGDLEPAGAALRCARRHSFDVARQGYVNLLPGHGDPPHADTPEMLDAREEFLGAGWFRPLLDLLTTRVRTELPDSGGLILDAGAGSGYYLRGVLESLPQTAGLAADVSKHAVRRAVRGEPRIGGIVCDLWRGLPVRSGSVSTVLNIFAPRHGAEFRRVLRADGLLLVVTPNGTHLAELVERLGLLSVDEHKLARLDAELDPHLSRVSRSEHTMHLELGHAEAVALAGMGPSSRHRNTDELRARIGELPEPVRATASVTVSVYRKRTDRSAQPTGVG